MKIVHVKTKGPLFEKRNMYQGAMIEAARRIGEEVEIEARRHAPVRSGLLVSTIYSALSDISGTRVAAVVFAGGPKVKYARWVEEGHRLRNGQFLPGVWFMRKGYERGLEVADKIVQEEFAKIA